MTPPASSLPPPASDFAPGLPVKFTGGRYNGFTGTIRLMGETVAAIIILYDNRPCEVIEDLRHCSPLQPETAFCAPAQERGTHTGSPAGRDGATT